MTAPADFTVTQDGDSAQLTLAWTHTGTDTKFEVLYRPTTGGAWTRAIVATKATFGSGPYEYVTASTKNTSWAVRALASNGTPSTYASEDFTGEIDGTWLLPVKNAQVVSAQRAWIGRDSEESVREQSYASTQVPGRAEEVSQPGVLHLEKGSLFGYLQERHGLTAKEWLTRLDSLIERMDSYSFVWLTNNREHMKVEVTGTPRTRRPVFLGGDAYEVSCGFRELA